MRQTKMSNFDIDRKWYVVDATDLVLGRLATQVANILLGKHKVTFTPHEDQGDFVIIINAKKVKLTGNKLDGKVYKNHSRYAGNMRERTARVMRDKYSSELVYEAVKGMLTRNRLNRKAIKKMFVYEGAEHNHQAQNPQVLKLTTTKKKVLKQHAATSKKATAHHGGTK